MLTMHAKAIHLLVFIVLIPLSTAYIQESTTQNTNDPEVIELRTNPDDSLNGLEDVLLALSNLTASQKLVWDQQRSFEQELVARNREEEARQAERSTALEEEQHYLKSIWGALSRKLKALTRSLNKDPHSASVRPKDCADLYLDGEEVSGVYQVWPTWSKTNFSVYCDMETEGGGWTVIHRWGNYSFPQDYFKRVWAEYKTGFGNLETAFWLGNDLIFALTSQGAYELRFDMDGHPKNTFAQYRGFWIENELQMYKVHVEAYVNTGTAGDIFSAVNNVDFATFERQSGSSNCLNYRPPRPGWWFEYSCKMNQVFALSFVPSSSEEQVVFKNEMKIRPAHFLKMKESS